MLKLKQGGKKTVKDGLSLLNYNHTLIDNQQAIADIFNNYFSAVVEEIVGTNQTDRILNKITVTN